ncbi:MAG: hypothetical protein M3O71_07410 [Bacteroidota bacterium]|nr:hypothetical protein [Bacteroidota bacterium]
METIQFKYNKGFGFISFFGILSLFIFNLIKSFNYTDIADIKIMIGFEAIMLLFLIIVGVKYFVPVITNKIALEINKEGIIDNTRHNQFYWGNIKFIRQVNLKNSSAIEIGLLDSNSTNLIRLQYIAGTDYEIFNAVENYFKHVK